MSVGIILEGSHYTHTHTIRPTKTTPSHVIYQTCAFACAADCVPCGSTKFVWLQNFSATLTSFLAAAWQNLTPSHILCLKSRVVSTPQHKGRPHKEKHVFFRALPEKGGGGLPMPEFFGPFFTKKKSLKLVHFYSKLMIFVCFLSSLSSKLPSLLL